MSLAAEALLAATGIDPEALTAAHGREAERLPKAWRGRVKAWFSAEKPAKFRMFAKPPHEATLTALTDGMGTEDSASLVGGLQSPDLAQEYLTVLSNAREFVRSEWPALRLDTPTGPLLLEPSRMVMQAAWSTYALVNDPSRILDEIDSGTVTAELVEVLRATYPGLTQMLVSMFQEEISLRAGRKKSYRVPWRQERVVRIVFGMPLSGAMTEAKQPPPRMAAPKVEISFDAAGAKTKAQTLSNQ